MKILIACDSFKGCMTSQEVESCIRRGIVRQNPSHEVIQFPMADGGEGTADVFCDILEAKMDWIDTVDAYGNDIKAPIAFDDKTNTAVMDVASCIGLNMVEKSKRNPMVTSSCGVGIMMKEAIERGYKNMIVGLGGSSTNDGGMGLLSAFGVKFYDKYRKLLKPSLYSLPKIAFIDKRSFEIPKDLTLIVACDVKNRLLGTEGATYVFGKQKGIYCNQMAEIDEWMCHYRNKIEQTFHVDINELEGSGAAGGIGSILLSVFQAQMHSGIDIVMEMSGFNRELKGADLVITGEGQTDAQTMYGKVVFGITKRAQIYNVPVICLSGALSKGYEQLYEEENMFGIFSSADRAMTFQQALKTSPEKLEALTYSVMRLIEGFVKRTKTK